MQEMAKKIDQPTYFAFEAANIELANKIIAKYPAGKQASAVIALLDMAQRQSGGWLPRVAMDYVANFLDMAPIRVYEVASFYTMFNLAPVGKNFIQICGTTPCWLRGAADILKACENKLNIKLGETTSDNLFTLSEVECLGACVNAPIVQINDDYYEDLTPELMENIIEELKKDNKVSIGSQIGRKCSAPIGELPALKDIK
jgi:NADH-quinone oxidoreductase subunit E